MDLSDNVLLGLIVSIVGIVIGWMLNQFSQWFRARKEDKKKLKEILYHLLELYNLFHRSDVNKFIGIVKEVVLSKIPKSQQSDELMKLMDKVYGNIAEQFVKPEILHKLKIQLENYENSIKSLASVDPVLAYYISSKNNINQTFSELESVYDRLENEYDQHRQDIATGKEMAFNVLKPSLHEENLKEIEKQITKIAWKVNPVVWLKSKKVISRVMHRRNRNLKVELEKYMDAMLASQFRLVI
ncbi:hypothetical protein [uncultured Draconibacterium sp.]|uniref:hypothetical protein n=1 Tax=uncultured Draconibacterium sp. TaxID=1573823 RepID=UPI002AA89ADF|nr:hypothetical protein [uncultured Draconibacterium sp.]